MSQEEVEHADYRRRWDEREWIRALCWLSCSIWLSYEF